MKDAIEEVKSEIQAKLAYWQSFKSKKMKAALICLFIAVVGLKVITTAYTFDWLSNVFS